MRNHQTVFHRGYTIVFPLAIYKGFNFSTSLPRFALFHLFDSWYPSGEKWLCSGLYFHFSNDYAEHLFMCLLAIWRNSHLSVLFILKTCFPFSCGVVKIPHLYIYSGYKTFIRYMIRKYFLPFCGLFCFLANVLWCETFLILMKSNISFFLLFLVLLVSHLRVHCQIQDHEDLHMLSFKIFMVLAVIFRSLHSELIFVCNVK